MKDLGGWGKINKAVYDPGGVWDSLFTRQGESRCDERTRPSRSIRRPSSCSAGPRSRTWA